MRFIDINGTLVRGRRSVSGSANVQDEEVKEPSKLAELLRKAISRITEVEAKLPDEPAEFQVNCPGSGGTVSVYHNFDCPVRWYLVDWRKRDAYLIPTKQAQQGPSYVQYDMGTPTFWANAAGNFTVGQIIRMKSVRDIIGIRFAWTSNAGTAYNIKCTLWSTAGVALATKTVAVANYGFYDAIFDTPVSSDLTGGDVTITMYQTTGARVSYSTDVAWAAVTLEFPDYKVIDHAVDVAGDAFPSAHRAARHYMLEPIFGNNDANPELVLQSTSTSKRLDFKSYVPGTAVIRVEPSQYGLK